jgi:hypothetical protein
MKPRSAASMGPLRLRWFFRSRQPPASVKEVLDRHRRGATRIETLIRVFYAFPLYWYLSSLPELRPLMAPPAPTLQWPVAWLGWVGVERFAPLVLAFGIASAGAALFRPESRTLRALAFVGLFEVLALKFSFGKIHHLMHAWIFASFLFIGLPSGWSRPESTSRSVRQGAHLVFSAAQVALCMTYSLAGLGKLVGSAYQAAIGEVTTLHPSALARHLADRIFQTHADSWVGPSLIEHGAWLWSGMLLTVYLQLFALWAAFRPRLHRLWGAGLVAFHATSILTLTIDFNPAVPLLALLLLASPSAPRFGGWRTVAGDLPIVGALLRLRPRSWPLRSASSRRPATRPKRS